MGADLHTDLNFSYNQTRIPPAIYQRQISSSHSESSGIQDRARGTGGCRTPEVAREGSHRRSSSALRTGLLQPIICGSEATRGMASGVKCQSSKRICNQGQLQDGNVQHSSSSLGRRQMGSNIGSQGCLFPHPYASQGLTFPEVYVTEQSLAVQGPPVRVDCSSVPIYLGYETSCKGTEETRDKSTYIPGRHDNFPYRRDHSQASSRYCSNSTTGIGIPHQLGKSQLVPVSTIVYLGMEFTLKSSLVRPPMDKCLEIKELAQKFMDNAYMTARQWSILLGKLAFLATMVPQGRLHQRELQFHLRQHWDFNWDLQTTVQIPMTESVQQTLSWWTHIPNLRVGKPISQPSPSRTIFTDASLEGWGVT